MQKLIELKKEILQLENLLLMEPPNKVVIDFCENLLSKKKSQFSNEIILLARERSYSLVCKDEIVELLRCDHVRLCAKEIKAELDSTK